MAKIQEGAQPDDRKSGYELPICDVDKEKRNFAGVEKKQWYNLDEIRQGDFFGTTDTDEDTDDKMDNTGPYSGQGGYSKIYSKKTAQMRPFKSSSPRTKDN